VPGYLLRCTLRRVKMARAGRKGDISDADLHSFGGMRSARVASWAAIMATQKHDFDVRMLTKGGTTAGNFNENIYSTVRLWHFDRDMPSDQPRKSLVNERLGRV